MKNFNKLIKEALTPDFLKESVYDDPIKKKAEQGDTMNENKSIYDAKINQLPKEIQDALKGEWEDDDFEDVTVYYHERGPKEGTGYVNFAMFNPSAGDELHKSLTKAGLKLDPLRSFQDGNFIKVYLNKPINEIVTSDYEERVNLVVDSYFNGDPKVKEAAKEYASIKAARTMGGRYHTVSLFKDFYNKYNPLIANQALEAVDMADDDAMFNESINEAKELTQDDIYNFLKPKFKDTKRATYEVDKVGKQVVVSWKITKTGYKDSKGDLFIDLDDMDFTSNYGGGKNWNTKAQLLSGLKKFIRDDAKSIHG